MELLCKRCDVYVGHAGAGVAKPPEDKEGDLDWLRDHCWICGRSRAEVEADPYDNLPEEKPESSTELTRYADKAMFEAEEITDILPRVYLVSATPDPLGSIAAMSKMYKGEVARGLDQITEAEREHFWEESFKTHLKAPWEAVDFHFMIEGVSRAFTHQIVRQRTAVYAQESMRFAVKEKIAARPGPLTASKKSARERWERVMEFIWENYLAQIADGIPAEEARGLLPHDTLTRLHYKTNLRNLADHLGNRLCTQAQFEWRMVASSLREAVASYVPPLGIPSLADRWHDRGLSNAWQFERIADSTIFRPVCYSLGHCPFTAEFDRGCTIRERVDQGRFDLIEEAEWMADPKAGWVS